MRKVFGIVLLLASFSWAGTTSILLSATDSGGIISLAATNYLPLAASHSTSLTEQDVIEYLPPGTLSNLRCDLNRGPTPGTVTITLRVGAADTSVTCSLSGSVASCTDSTHTATVGADPRVSIKLVPASSPNFQQIGCTIFFQRT